MIAGATLAGTAVSLAAVGYLAATDPKRRSAFRLRPLAVRYPRLAWTAALLPGVAVAWLAGGGGLLVWAGAVTVAGWGVAAVRPESVGAVRPLLSGAGAGLSRLAAGLAASGREGARALRGAVAPRLAAMASGADARRGSPDRVAALEARVAALEAELAALRGVDGWAEAGSGGSSVVVELALPARR